MTYKHKLSRRLALSRFALPAFALTATLIAMGCEMKGEPTGGLGPPGGNDGPPPVPMGAPQHVTIDSVRHNENGDGTYGVTVHYTPDTGLDSLFVRVRHQDGSWQGLPTNSPATYPNPQLFTLPCTQANYEIQSRSYRQGLRSDPILRDARTYMCGSPSAGATTTGTMEMTSAA